MINQPLHDRQLEGQDDRQADGVPPASLFADLYALTNLQQAYAYIQENCGELAIDPLAFETLEANGVEAFLQQMSNDLQARTYHPAPLEQQALASSVAESSGLVAVRDLTVQVALKRLLESAFPSSFPSWPEAEQTIQGLAGHIDKGLCRVYALNLNESPDDGGYERLVERAGRKIDDPQLLGLLKEILAASSQPELLAPLLAGIACAGVDQILQQAKAFGREENFLHVQCTRVANELVVLTDGDPRYDWIVPAVQQRLREELSDLHYDPVAVESQTLDLTGGEPLRFLDFELRLVKRRHGEARVHYRLIEEAHRRQVEKATAQRRLLGCYHSLRFLQPCLSWIGRQRSWQLVRDAYRKVNSIRASWSHLPITLYPVVAFLFGWRSPAAWLCLALIFLCNWRWSLGIGRSACVWAGCHKSDTVMGVFALAAVICLYPVVSELYANRSQEDPAPGMPPGFHWCRYNKDSPWGTEFVPYALYVPPHFQGEKGPFPLIVFLHGHGERIKRRLFLVGLPQSIANRFGPNSPNGRFKFVAFFPIDPTGQWETGSVEVEDAMLALDYVIRRHRIDPTRVYLTGHSTGGSGVWRLAETYPDKWAAVAPLCSFISPDVQKVRHLPAWIFHGAKDKIAPVERERNLVQQFKEANADMRYTEIPNQEHRIWAEAYDPKDFYDWLTSKKKDR